MVKEGTAKKLQTWAEDSAAQWMVQPLLWLPLALGVGIATYFNMGAEPSLQSLIIAFGTILGLTILGTRQDKAIVHVALIAALWAVSGMCVAKLRVMGLDAPVIRKDTGWRTVQGTISQLDPLPGAEARVVLDNPRIEKMPAAETPHRVRITLKKPGDVSLTLGQVISVRTMLHPPSLPATASSYDFQRHYYLQRIGGIGFSPMPVTIVQDVRPGSLLAWFGHMRTVIQAMVEGTLPPDQAGIVIALLTGAQTGVPDTIMNDYRASGLVHILSVSGMHISMIAGAVFFMVRLILVLIPYVGLHWPVKKIAAIVALLVTLSYVAMIGPLLPAWRAMMMTGLLLLAVILDRVALSLRTLALAALVLLVTLPESLTNIGFQLSFMAVFALIAVYEQVRDRWPGWLTGWPHIVRFSVIWGGGVIMTGMIATLATAPLILYHFQQLPLYGAIANAAATPILTFITMPLVVVAFIALPFGMSHWPIALMGDSVHWMNMVAGAVAHLSHNVMHIAQGSFLALILGLVSVFLLCVGGRVGKGAGVAALVLSAGLWGMQKTPDVLVYPPGKLWMVQVNADMWVVPSIRTDTFVREQWQNLLAIPPENVIALRQAKKDKTVSCDKSACRMTSVTGQKISVVMQPYVAREECLWADWVISASRLGRACPDKQIDRYRLKYAGPVVVREGSIEELLSEKTSPRPWRKS